VCVCVCVCVCVYIYIVHIVHAVRGIKPSTLL